MAWSDAARAAALETRRMHNAQRMNASVNKGLLPRSAKNPKYTVFAHAGGSSFGVSYRASSGKRMVSFRSYPSVRNARDAIKRGKLK